MRGISKVIICGGVTYLAYRNHAYDGKMQAISLSTNALCNYVFDLATNFRLPSHETIAQDTKKALVSGACYEAGYQLASNVDGIIIKQFVHLATQSLCNNAAVEQAENAIEMIGEVV